jgi:hypothetical protein
MASNKINRVVLFVCAFLFSLPAISETESNTNSVNSSDPAQVGSTKKEKRTSKHIKRKDSTSGQPGVAGSRTTSPSHSSSSSSDGVLGFGNHETGTSGGSRTPLGGSAPGAAGPAGGIGGSTNASSRAGGVGAPGTAGTAGNPSETSPGASGSTSGFMGERGTGLAGTGSPSSGGVGSSSIGGR